jgi:small subunit ribosomal protein S21
MLYFGPFPGAGNRSVRLEIAAQVLELTELMAIRIKSRSGESTEQMMRRFKKLCEKEGLTKDIKRKEFYEKPSERRRRAMRKSINRKLKELGMGPGGVPLKEKEKGPGTGRPGRRPE